MKSDSLPFTDDRSERVVLQALLRHVEFRDVEVPRLSPDVFTRPSHRRIFQAVVWAHADRGGELTQDTFLWWLQHSRVDEAARLRAMLSYEAVQESPSKLSAPAALLTLRDLHRKRAAADLASFVISKLRDDEAGEDILREAGERLSTIAVASMPGEARIVTPSDTVDARRAEYEDQEANPEKYRGVLLGIDELDRIMNGLYPQEIMLLVGRQGAGKTRALFNLAYNVSRESHVAFFTVEMPAAQIERIYSSRDAMVDYLGLKTATLKGDAREKYFESLERQRVSAAKFHIIDMPRGCTTPAVEAKLRMLLSAFPVKLAVIDYLGLMESSRRWPDGWKEVEQIGRELKQIARALHVPIITAAQATRDMARALKEGEELGLEFVALSDRLSDHADVVIILHQSKADAIGNVLHWDLVKHRDGTQIRFSTYFDPAHNFIGNQLVELSVGHTSDRRRQD